jgi:Protein of unknown function (DUF1236)
MLGTISHRAARQHGCGATIMTRSLCLGAVLGSLLIGADLVHAQPQSGAAGSAREAPKVTLSPAQRETIFTAVRRSTVSITPPPGNLAISVGAAVPASVPLYGLPDAAVRDVPGVKSYKYTIINDTLILVDPASMLIVALIRQ